MSTHLRFMGWQTKLCWICAGEALWISLSFSSMPSYHRLLCKSMFTTWPPALLFLYIPKHDPTPILLASLQHCANPYLIRSTHMCKLHVDLDVRYSECIFHILRSVNTYERRSLTYFRASSWQDVLNGYNGTIMAYGQTGAGKTYTLSDKLSTGGGITAVGGE